MKILVACEESQAVTIELRKLGHEAYSCDIEPCSGGHPEWHLKGDVFDFLEPRKRYPGTFEIANEASVCTQLTWETDGEEGVVDIPAKWDMIIAFPPCTFLSNSGACRLYPTKGNLDQER